MYRAVQILAKTRSGRDRRSSCERKGLLLLVAAWVPPLQGGGELPSHEGRLR